MNEDNDMREAVFKEAAEIGGNGVPEREKMENGGEEALSLEEILIKLDEIVDLLGTGDCTLEQSFALYKDGMALLKDGNDKIDRVEKKMLEIDKEGELHEFSGEAE